ncbi:MAG: TM2 domain-containing protein [Chitinispirillales bacterium]|jgi:TM2 domain-containing membrane protein YozV|nr:TM2 domain-containing protein [Chitinispirillales bacterium]
MTIDSSKLDIWLASNQKFFSAKAIPFIRERIAQMPESKTNLLDSVEFKNPKRLLLVSLLAGEFGVDRFMLGHIGLGFLKLCTFGGLFAWAFAERFTIQSMTRELNFKNLMQIIDQYGN